MFLPVDRMTRAFFGLSLYNGIDSLVPLLFLPNLVLTSYSYFKCKMLDTSVNAPILPLDTIFSGLSWILGY